ncbi:MAG: DNA repair protein RadA [Clostridia bacterium]|jgi:DNA repair protein radA|nr:dNA repair protein radA [Clostridium sp. CAG:452]
MAKPSTVFVCSNCGNESSKWFGRCPACNEWNTCYEEKINLKSSGKSASKKTATTVKLDDVKKQDIVRTKTGFDELDRVLGGGLVKGSLTLLGGEPGIGKSTLILQICDKIKGEGQVLYVSGEESAQQIKIRADRLGIKNNDIVFLGETDIDVIEDAILKTNPKLVIIDSIQTMYSDEITSGPGSVSQVREITARIMKMCKQEEITTIIIGHVTKDGNIAGPRVLEHMVDTVLYLEGERYFAYRILRGVKNRFGSTNEIGMFEMNDIGMCEIDNPSSVLLSEKNENVAGSIVVASIEGTRPILVELQALTATSVFGMPRRTANGIDYNRLTLLIAVLEKRTGLPLGNQDVYLNIVGGIKINEPALDLGIILAVSSSFKNIPIPNDVIAIGEVGLTGEVRSVNQIEKRIKEAEKLGFKKCIIPESNKKLLKDTYKLDIIGVQNISEAMRCLELKR